MYEEKLPDKFTVIFMDWNGAVLKSEQVEKGQSATPPANPTRVGYTFTGWDKPYNNITSDVTITALYVINTYTVTFKDWDGTVLKTQTVEYGKAATAPSDPTREGYTFTGWDKDFSCVTANLTVTALYVHDEVQTHTVTFKDWDGSVLKTEKVEHGKSATAPTDPVREGYIFVGWSKDFSCITSDLTVVAQYQKIEDVSIILKYDKYSSYIGEEFTLEYTVFGMSASDVYWTTSDESVATVDENGLIHSLAKGAVAISVVSNDGKHFATCNVTVHGYGDADDDGQVNTADAVKILKLSAGIIPEAALNIHLADANRDGAINTADAVLVLKYAAGIIEL